MVANNRSYFVKRRHLYNLLRKRVHVLFYLYIVHLTIFLYKVFVTFIAFYSFFVLIVFVAGTLFDTSGKRAKVARTKF